MAEKARRVDYYVNPDFIGLKVENPHFSVVDSYNLLLLADGDMEVFGRQLGQDFFTAIVEDSLRQGEVELEFFEGEERDGLKLTHPSYKEGKDIVRLTLNGAKRRRDKGLAWERQYWELLVTRRLRREWKTCPKDAVYVWLYPADETGEYGYKPVGLAYVYIVKGEPGVGRKIKGEFFRHALSLEGHRRLWERLSGKSIVGDSFNEAWLLNSPLDISDCVVAQSADEVFRLVDEIVEEGNGLVMNQAIDEVGGLSRELFDDYQPQIDEAVKFLLEAMGELYKVVRINLSQKEVDNLEIAYSFARRAVENYSRERGIVATEQLWADYQQQLEFNQSWTELKQEIGESELYQEAMAFNWHLELLYGDLRVRRVGGFGCPGGKLRELGLGGLDGPTLASFGQLDLDPSGAEGLEEKKGFDCPNCGEFIEQGSGDTCPHCGYTKQEHARKTGVSCG